MQGGQLQHHRPSRSVPSSETLPAPESLGPPPPCTLAPIPLPAAAPPQPPPLQGTEELHSCLIRHLGRALLSCSCRLLCLHLQPWHLSWRYTRWTLDGSKRRLRRGRAPRRHSGRRGGRLGDVRQSILMPPSPLPLLRAGPLQLVSSTAVTPNLLRHTDRTQTQSQCRKWLERSLGTAERGPTQRTPTLFPR